MHANSEITIIFEYLYLRDIPQQADLIIGFGHFDPKIPQKCGELYEAGLAPRILFTGGIGAGSAGLIQPEGIFFKNYLLEHFPNIPDHAILVESQSTNTAENIQFSDIIMRKYWGKDFNQGIHSALLVANAYRQRRVNQTLLKLAPQLQVYNTPPDTNYQLENELFSDKGEQLDKHILGEISRLLSYPANGWIAPVELPEAVKIAYEKFQ